MSHKSPVQGEEEVDNLKNLEMSREEFENYVSVDDNVIPSEIPTPEDIVAEI